MSNSTPINGFSEAGIKKLREMTENSQIFTDFLKFHGQIFKHSVDVSLEFFVQKPETKFIATREQWESIGRKIAQGSEAIRFYNDKGNIVDMYDFSQIEESNPPYLWTVNKSNVGKVKAALGIPEKTTLIHGLVVGTVSANDVTACMRALGIPPQQFQSFSRSYLSAVQLIIAGRLESGGSVFNIKPDTSALQLLKTESNKLAFITYAANAAKAALMKIETVIQNMNTMERNEKNDIREMDYIDTRGTAERAGRGTSGDSSGAVGEWSDRSEDDTQGRRTRLGDNSGSEERQEHTVVSRVQEEDDRRSGDVVQIRPDMRSLQSEYNRSRADNGRTADRNVRNEVDDVHGGELSSSGNRDESTSQISDSSSLGGKSSVGLQGLAGREVRRGESTPDGFRGNSEVGTSENVLLGQHSDERGSFSAGDGSLDDKLNSVFFSEETEEPSTTQADGFVLDEDMAKLTDEEQLTQLTLEISQREIAITELVREKKYAQVTETAQELEELNARATALKTEIQKRPITEDDVNILRGIEPKRKSVQNLLEHEVAQTPKFESLLNSEMGEKSAYEMRKSDKFWIEDDSKKVSLVDVKKRDILPKNLMKIRRNNDIARGTFTNQSTNLNIIFSKRSIEEIIAKAIQDDKRNIPIEARIASLYQMQELIEQSVCFDSQVSEYNTVKSKNKSPNTLFMHQMYGLVRYGDDYYLARLSVEESYTTDRNNNFIGTSNRIYNLRDMKITPIEANRIFDPAVAITNNDEDTSTSVTMISIPQLYCIVKAYDKSFYENPDAPGREEREAEMYAHAEYLDAVETAQTGMEITSETDKQLKRIADSRAITVEAAKEIVDTNINFPSDNNPDDDFAEKIHAAFADVVDKHEFGTEQQHILKRFANFAVKYNLTDNIFDNAFKKAVVFKTTYKNREYLSEKFFGSQLNSIEKEINEAINKHFSSMDASAMTESDVQFNALLEEHGFELVNDSPFAQDGLIVLRSPDGKETGFDGKELAIDYLSQLNAISPEEQMDTTGQLMFSSGDAYSEKVDTYIKDDTVSYEIYQMKPDEKYHGIRYQSFDDNSNIPLNYEDYSLVYEGNWSDIDGWSAEEKLNSIYKKFNIAIPEDFKGHSLSVSDVVVVRNKDSQTAHYVDDVGFSDFTDFFKEKESTLKEEPDISEVTSPKHKPTRAEQLYKQFTEMFPNIASGAHSYERYGKDGDAFEPLSVEHLGGNTYGFMTYYVQNGDVMRDPDFTFKLDHENQTLTILEYQQDGVPGIGTVYQQVFDENGNSDRNLLSALEKNFMQNLKNAKNAERPLTVFADSKGERTVVLDGGDDKVTTEEEVIRDSTPELREVLNTFSGKHGLGELNVEPSKYNWSLSETMQDGTTFKLGELHNANYGMPFTPDSLRDALERFEKETADRHSSVSELYNRRSVAEMHGGISALPKVQDNLPEITYASNPSGKISNNISAIRELLRLEVVEKRGEELYDSRSSQYNSKQASDNRLRQYCGWGGLPQVFDERFSQYNYQREQLRQMLSPEEYSAATASTLNAHYTPQIIIDAMYKAIQNMELPRNSRILEPACGTGNFISRMPHSLGNVEVIGVELDSITARIAKQLNRDNDNVRIIESGFEHTHFENNSFDLAIGNVPFGDYNLNDPDYVQDWRIHDAFFRKALDKVAPGGVVAFITSSGTMDKANPKIREYLATQAELVGAIRLPNNAFSDAGTKVTSDIIFLKKRDNPLQAHEPKPDWCYTVPNADGLKINSYFVSNPQMILGKMEKTTHFDMLTCTPFEGTELETQLNEAIKNLNTKITVSRREKVIKAQRSVIEPWGKNFTYQPKDGKIYYRQGEKMNEVKCSGAEQKKLMHLCEIRDVTRRLIDLQKTSISDDKLIPVRENLNKVYDEYKTKHGDVSSKEVKKLFGSDSDYPIIQSLEQWDEENGKYNKADIFFRRTVNPASDITAAESAEEALQISLDRRGKPDIAYMAMLLDEKYSDLPTVQVAEKVCTELLDKGYIFIDPEKNIPDKPYSGVVERSEYLSGNVRMKLAIANEYAKNNPEFARNVSALEKVIPEDIKAEEISVQMGCTWIEPQDYTAFLEHLSGRERYNSRRCDVSYSPVTGEFDILNAGSKKDLNLNETTTYGTADFNMYQLAEKILNQRRIVVQREKPHPKDPSKTVTRTDPKATKIALEKAKAIRAEFKKWIFSESKRKAKYERKYNDIFNSLVGREYDGSKLTFPGITALNDFSLRSHQKNCVARAIYGGNTLAAHVVGAGKSAVMFSAVMKKKELGLITKACVVVPKPLTEQTANEWRKIYPDAKLLTVTNDDLSSEAKRNLFTARVAAGAYDAVILSQEQFEKIPMSRQYRIEFMQKELDGLEDMLRERKLENSGKKDYSTKSIEKAKKQLKAKIEKLTDPKAAARAKDDLLEFEQLGFDYLVVDEAHAYKNGFVTTKMTNVAGVTTRPSGRAEDMQMKTDYFNEQLGQGHILFATGTPVSNSMTELYVMTRYLRPDLLKATGVDRFDDWAATFGNVVTKNQQAADGTLKLRTSFASFANLPELMAMYKEFADVQSTDKLQLPRPKLKTGKPQIVKVPASPEQRAYVQDLAARAKAIADGQVEPYEDNLLKITGEARLIGLGNQAIKSLYEKRGEELPYEFIDTKDSKVDKCIENVAAIYKQTEETKGVQIIFSDIAVNSDKGNFSVYDYIKKELTETYGIPEDEIIFAPKSDSKNRENIFRDINTSKYRVVIASTGTLGTGANIQQNLYALHHIDVPWKPSDFEQREGRILRQGNRYDEVEIFNYVTEGTLDSYLYQTVTDKARFIAQLLDDKCPARVSEDCDEKVLTFGEIQAAAEGNPDFKRRIELANEIAELTMLQNEYAHETALTQTKIESIPKKIESEKIKLEQIVTDKNNTAKIKDIIITKPNGSRISEKKALNAYLFSLIQEKLENADKEIPEMKIGSFELKIDKNNLSGDVQFTVTGEQSYSCVAGVTENQDNYQRLSNLFEKMIPKREEDTKHSISSLEENLKQAEERAVTPFAHEEELENKIQELNELEEKLAGLSVQENDVYDPEEEPIIETAEEKSQRESIYNVDDSDYQPTEKGNDTPRNNPPKAKI